MNFILSDPKIFFLKKLYYFRSLYIHAFHHFKLKYLVPSYLPPALKGDNSGSQDVFVGSTDGILMRIEKISDSWNYLPINLIEKQNLGQGLNTKTH